MRQLIAPAIAMFMLSSVCWAQLMAADPSSPFFLWENDGLRGVVKTLEYADAIVQYAADGRSRTERGMTSVWHPTERRLVLGGGTVFTYDAEGYVTHVSWVGGRSPHNIRTIAYSMLADGGRVGTELDGDGRLQSVTTYNARGLRVGLVQYLTTPLGLRTEYEHYDNGYASEHRNYDAGGRLEAAWRLTYVFDAQGNWVAYTKYAWVPVLGRFETEGTTERRTITYY